MEILLSLDVCKALLLGSAKSLPRYMGLALMAQTAAFIALAAEIVARAPHDLLLPVNEEYVQFGLFVPAVRVLILQNLGWCPCLAFKVIKVTPNLVYWALHSGLVRDQGGLNHSHSSTKECVMHRRLYSRQEATSHHWTCDRTSCEDIRINQQSMGSICAMLLDGQVPLLRIPSNEDGTPQAPQVVPYKSGIKYVAISHVWSQGMATIHHDLCNTT